MKIQNYLIYKLAMATTSLPFDDRRTLASLGALDGFASIEATMNWCRCSDSEARTKLRELYLNGYLVETCDNRIYQPQMLCAIANNATAPGHKRFRPRPGNISRTRREAILQRDGNSCVYCASSGGDRALTLDHVIPKSKGGLTVESNLVAACHSCNQEKADHAVEIFLEVA